MKSGQNIYKIFYKEMKVETVRVRESTASPGTKTI